MAEEKQETATASKVLEGLYVKSSVDGASVPVIDLWKEKPVLFVLIRRFGCGLCMNGVSRIEPHRLRLESMGLRVIVVGLDNDRKQIDRFLHATKFGGEVFIDEEKKCYTQLKCVRKGPSLKTVGAIFKSKPQFIFQTNLKGDFNQQGGTFVIDAEGDFLFAHIDKYAGHYPKYEDIFQAIAVHSKKKQLATAKEEEENSLEQEADTSQNF